MANDDDRASGKPTIDPEILVRAERAVAALGGDFVAQVRDELSEYCAMVERDDIAADEASVERLFAFAHDLRGQGGTFGYPLLSTIGGSLCHFIEARGSRLENADSAVLRAHLDAAAAIVASAISEEGDAVSRALIDSLDKLVRTRLTGQS